MSGLTLSSSSLRTCPNQSARAQGLWRCSGCLSPCPPRTTCAQAAPGQAHGLPGPTPCTREALVSPGHLRAPAVQGTKMQCCCCLVSAAITSDWRAVPGRCRETSFLSVSTCPLFHFCGCGLPQAQTTCPGYMLAGRLSFPGSSSL